MKHVPCPNVQGNKHKNLKFIRTMCLGNVQAETWLYYLEFDFFVSSLLGSKPIDLYHYLNLTSRSVFKLMCNYHCPG